MRQVNFGIRLAGDPFEEWVKRSLRQIEEASLEDAMFIQVASNDYDYDDSFNIVRGRFEPVQDEPIDVIAHPLLVLHGGQCR